MVNAVMRFSVLIVNSSLSSRLQGRLTVPDAKSVTGLISKKLYSAIAAEVSENPVVGT
jgi:hypothetical protein